MVISHFLLHMIRCASSEKVAHGLIGGMHACMGMNAYYYRRKQLRPCELNCNEDLTGEILPANDFECSAVALYLLDVRESNGEMRARFGVDSRLISSASERGASPTTKTTNLKDADDEEKELEEKEGREREDEREGACNLRLVEVTRDTEVETWPARLPATIAISCTRREGWRREKVLTATSDASWQRGYAPARCEHAPPRPGQHLDNTSQRSNRAAVDTFFAAVLLVLRGPCCFLWRRWRVIEELVVRSIVPYEYLAYLPLLPVPTVRPLLPAPHGVPPWFLPMRRPMREGGKSALRRTRQHSPKQQT